MNLVLLLIFLAVFSKNRKDRRRSDVFIWIMLFYLGITMLSIFISSPVFWMIGIGLILYVASKRKKDKESEKRAENGQSAGGTGRTYARQESRKEASGGEEQPAYTSSRILPHPLPRRLKIIRTFNQKYGLSLTKEEISRIANASYVSEAWKREVEAMTVKYDTEGQWFAGPTDWLRVYIYVFEIQNISSDFALQEQICLEALDQAVAYACQIPGATVEERVKRVNDRFFTRFDEMTFMIAYRFLQKKGRNYDLSRPDPVRNVDRDLEEAMNRYRGSSGE